MDRKVGGELVIAYGQRDEMERGCEKLVDLEEVREDGRLKRQNHVGDRRVQEVSGLTEGRVDGLGTTEEGKGVRERYCTV